MAGIFANMKDKVNNFIAEDSQMSPKQDIQPRNSKSVTIGASKGESVDRASQNRIFDTSDDICVIRGIQLLEDSGNYMLSVIERLEKGQLVVVDFSESDEKSKDSQFHVLWGATMALHGTFKMLDKTGNLVIFSSNQNKISEQTKPTVE